MGKQVNEPKHDLRVLCRALFERAKHWRTVAFILKVSIYFIGASVILFSFIPTYAPFVVALLSMAAELCSLRSAIVRRPAENLLRKLDFHDALGWEISSREVSDILIASPASLRREISESIPGKSYFASQRRPGIQRALENIQESAWLSKHLSRRSGHYHLILAASLILISIVSLVISIETIRNYNVLSNIGRFVTSTFMLIFSLGLLRSTLGYYRFSSKAEKTEIRSEELLRMQDIGSIQVIKLMYEYQLARASTPMLQTWIWHLMQDDLNVLWEEYRCYD